MVTYIHTEKPVYKDHLMDRKRHSLQIGSLYTEVLHYSGADVADSQIMVTKNGWSL